MSPAQTQVSIRMSVDLVSQIDGLAAHLANNPTYAPTGKLTRADALRLLVLVGLDEMKAKVGDWTTTEQSKK